MGPDWANEYDYEQPETGPPPPMAPPMPAPGPAIPTDHPPLVTPNLNMLTANVSSFPTSSASSARARAGLTMLLTAVGTGVGAALGGANGAGAGFFLTGAARNLYRAQSGLGSNDTGESAKSLTLGLLGLAAGGYLVYRCFAKKPRRSHAD